MAPLSNAVLPTLSWDPNYLLISQRQTDRHPNLFISNTTQTLVPEEDTRELSRKVTAAAKNCRWELKLCNQSIPPPLSLIKSTLESEIIYVF